MSSEELGIIASIPLTSRGIASKPPQKKVPSAGLLGCTPQARKPGNRPAVRPKKEPRESDRDTRNLLDRESYKSEAEGPGATPTPCMADRTQDMTTTLAAGGEGGYHL